MGRIEEIETLIVESRELDRRAAEVQGERELLVEHAEIDQLSDDYNRWYARAMAILPEEQHAEFKDLYDGGIMVKRIKTFLATPGEVNKMFDPQAETSVFGYWQHPFETTFHGSLMEQRQALALARQAIEVAAEEAEVVLVERVGRGLPRMIAALRTATVVARRSRSTTSTTSSICWAACCGTSSMMCARRIRARTEPGPRPASTSSSSGSRSWWRRR